MNTREAFEDWYEVDCYPCEHSNWFRLDSDGDYEFDEVQYAWRTWQAATAAALERAAEVCDEQAKEPAWHVAPTVPGLWLNSVFMKVEDVEQWHIDCQLHLECARWYGPIPPDGDKP